APQGRAMRVVSVSFPSTWSRFQLTWMVRIASGMEPTWGTSSYYMRAEAVCGRAASSSGACAPGSTTSTCRRTSFRSPTRAATAAAKAMAEPSTLVPSMRMRRVRVILMVFSPHAAPRPWGTIPLVVVHDLAVSGSGEQAGAPDIGALAVDPDRGSRLADADG